MAVRYDSLLAAALAGEIEARFAGAPVTALGLCPESWTLALPFAAGGTLWCFLHPEAGQILLSSDAPEALPPRLPVRRGQARTSGVIRVGDWRWIPFRRLILLEARALPDERVLALTLASEGGPPRYTLLLELPRNRRNALLLEPAAGTTPGSVVPADDTRLEGETTAWRIRAVLRERPGQAGRGDRYRLPAGRRVGIREPVPADEWTSVLAGLPPSERRGAALRHLAYLSPLNVEHVLAAGDVDAQYRRYLELRSGRAERWLLRRAWGLQPYVSRLGDPDAAGIPSILDGMERSAEDEDVRRRFECAGPPAKDADGPHVTVAHLAGAAASEAEAAATARIARALGRRRKRLARRLSSLRSELEQGEPPERLREAGHLLLARLREVPRGVAEIELPDFEGGSRTIDLDPRLTPAQNAERYYEAAARRQRALEKLPALIAGAERELRDVEAALDRLNETGEVSETIRQLAGVRPEAIREGAAGARARLPYHRFISSGGLEIRVGRSSKENDRLTFQHSAPDDVWLHAQSVPGAHVVLRWSRRDQAPPERDLREAAVIAALHSDSRHSGVVAVDWTRRKHVRKPRKAPPGSVAPERVKTLFVETDRSLLERLRPEP